MSTLDLKSIEPIFRENHVAYAGVFGSRARGDYRPDSDIDILVRFQKPAGYFTLVDVQDKLSRILKQRVDLVTVGALSPYLKDRILSEVQTIYEG